MKLSITFLILSIAFASCTQQQSETAKPTNEIVLTKQMFGDKWPFTVDSVLLECRDTPDVESIPIDMSAYIIHANGKEYALNGVAGSKFDLPGVDEIQRTDSTTYFQFIEAGLNTEKLVLVKVSTQPIFDEANKLLCK